MAQTKKKGWVDVSVAMKPGMVHWPGDPPFNSERFKDIDKGDSATVSFLSLGAHTGTHMDAPCHFIQGGASLDTVPLDAIIGPARIIAIKDTVSIKPEELAQHKIRKGERILFQTANSFRCWETDAFITDFVSLSSAAAQYLVEKHVATVGIDYLSVGGYKKDGKETHLALLQAGVWVIEGLDLSTVKPGRYDVVCLPLKILGADGAPARVIVRPRA